MAFLEQKRHLSNGSRSCPGLLGVKGTNSVWIGVDGYLCPVEMANGLAQEIPSIGEKETLAEIMIAPLCDHAGFRLECICDNVCETF